MRDGWYVVGREFTVEVLGCRFRLTGNAPALLDVLAELLDPSMCPTATGVDHVITVNEVDDGHSFVVNDFPGGDVTAERSVTWSLWLISQLAQELTRQTFVVHGACVEVGHRPVLIIGRSGAGKSTLTAALLAAGASVLSDELTELSSDARVIDGFRRAVMLEPDTLDVLDEAGFLGSLHTVRFNGADGAAVLVPVDHRLSRTGAEARPLIVVLGDRGVPFQRRWLRAAETAVGLVQHSVGQGADRRELLAVVASIVERSDGVELYGGDLTQRVNLLMNLDEW